MLPFINVAMIFVGFTGLLHPEKVLDFFPVLENPWKYLGGFPCFSGTE